MFLLQFRCHFADGIHHSGSGRWRAIVNPEYTKTKSRDFGACFYILDRICVCSSLWRLCLSDTLDRAASTSPSRSTWSTSKRLQSYSRNGTGQAPFSSLGDRVYSYIVLISIVYREIDCLFSVVCLVSQYDFQLWGIVFSSRFTKGYAVRKPSQHFLSLIAVWLFRLLRRLRLWFRLRCDLIPCLHCTAAYSLLNLEADAKKALTSHSTEAQ